MEKGVPLGVKLNLRKICLSVDWLSDLKFVMPEIVEDKYYEMEKNAVERFSNRLEESLTLYSTTGVDVEISCSSCSDHLLRTNPQQRHVQRGTLRRFL